MLRLACSLQSHPADVVSIASADNSLYLLYNSLYFSYSVHVATIAACFQTSAALLAWRACFQASCCSCMYLLPACFHGSCCSCMYLLPACFHGSCCSCMYLLPACFHGSCCSCMYLLPACFHGSCCSCMYLLPASSRGIAPLVLHCQSNTS